MAKLMGRRTPAQERALYQGLSTSQFAEEIDASDEVVYALVGNGWFGWTRDAAGRRVPECMDVRKPGAPRPHYRFHKSAVARFMAERAVVGQAA